jgi:alpha-beta hydrolase superfamily lysophospholipase
VAQITVVLAHGAGAGKDHPWMKRVALAFESAGFRVVTFNFPYIDAKKHVPDRPAVLEAHMAAVWRDAAKDAKGPLFAAGKSMGGRIASQVAAKAELIPRRPAWCSSAIPCIRPASRPAARRAPAEDYGAHVVHAGDQRSVRLVRRNARAGGRFARLDTLNRRRRRPFADDDAEGRRELG